jgi:uncharacterized protein (TIGR02145 family)
MQAHFKISFSLFVAFNFIFPFGNIQAQQLTPLKIGNQVWSQENLNMVSSDSWCYFEQDEYCRKYGRLYTWDAARQACPAGWHLPSQDEWKILIDYLGGEDVAAKKLADATSGFSLKYGGMARIGNYMLIDNYCAFWTASEYDRNHAWYMFLTPGNSNVTMTYFTKKYGFSVRCIKD